eukprot:scaffold111088_cov51-Attheya_sp.AAC.1
MGSFQHPIHVKHVHLCICIQPRPRCMECFQRHKHAGEKRPMRCVLVLSEDDGDIRYSGGGYGVSLCHEVEKKQKYLPYCEHQHKHFTPLVFSNDGCVECDAQPERG